MSKWEAYRIHFYSQVHKEQETLQLGKVTGITTTARMPVKPGFQAKFETETFGHAIGKLFRREVQSGDPRFDNDVFITTDTPDATKAFLQNDDVRATIYRCIRAGGTVEIKDNVVTYDIKGAEVMNGDPAVERLVWAVYQSIPGVPKGPMPP